METFDQFWLWLAPAVGSFWQSFVAVSVPLLTPIIAVVASYVAWQQWKLAKNKLKFDLFEKRYQIYLATRKVMADVLSAGKIEIEQVRVFNRETREAKWLFSDSVENFLRKELHQKLLDLNSNRKEFDPLPEGPERGKLVQCEREILNWFDRSSETVDNLFKPFLKLSS